jgi:glycosyltransferase involved in cell wall biosynthesis
MTGPSISVIIPTYNRAHLVPRSIRSALQAVQPGDEIIVVDDGSTDNTPAALAEFGDKIRFLPLPHAGPGATRNAGIRAGTKELVAFLDSDDGWDADKLAMQRAFMAARPNIVYSYTNLRVQEADGKVFPNYLEVWRGEGRRPYDEVLGPAERFSSIATLPAGRGDFSVFTGDLYPHLMHTFFVSSITMIVRRELAGDAFRYAEDVYYLEDLECFGRLARMGPVAYLDVDTATQFGHGGPRLTDQNTEVLTRARLTVLDRVWGQDRAYQEKNGQHYKEVMRELRLTLVRWLLVQGRTRDAGEVIRQIENCPLSMRILASLPGLITQGLLGLRRMFMSRPA